MFKIDQFTAANEAAIEQFSFFAKLSLGNFEKFTELGLGVARESIAQATRHAQSLAAARDVNEAIAINAAAVEPAIKRAYSYSRTAYEAAATTNEEVKRVLEANAAQLNKAAVSALEEALKYAPAGSESVVGNMKTAMAAAQSAYDNFAAINKQIYDTVEQNVATVQAATTKTAKRASKRK
ncbi:MAG TPA: phasin family protein [Usitatibacter sp.]|jgi:phasin family protein|nr:phasin family protein [Usitatibacter sp.]